MTPLAGTEAHVIDLLAGLGARLRPVVERLPPQPPARLLAAALDRWMLPRLDAEARPLLTGRCVEIGVSDFGLRLRLVLERDGFRPAPPALPVELRIVAGATTFWRLLRGIDDADRLFFERALLMEGDTELGLVLKNALDAIGPLWR